MRWSALLLVIGASAGCDRVFGLTLPDAADECVTGHDEDGDGMTDVCDGCPAHADRGGDDADGDGIGDACDPDPGCTTRALFTGFEALPAGLALGAGTWTHDGDDLRQSDVLASDALVHLVTPTFADAWVRAGATIVDTGTPNQRVVVVEVAAGVTIAGSRPTAGHGCELYLDGFGPRGKIIDHPDETQLAETPYSGAIDDGQQLIVELAHRAGEAMRCAVTGVNPAGAALAMAGPPAGAGEIMLSVSGSDVRFHWLEVLEPCALSPPAR